MKNIYRDALTGKFFKKGRAGTGRLSHMFLWQPVKEFLFFYIPDNSREPFWLDDYGFERV